VAKQKKSTNELIKNILSKQIKPTSMTNNATLLMPGMQQFSITRFAKLSRLPVLFFTICLLSNSLQAQPFCNEAQQGPGFPTDLTCETAVCALDAFCCDGDFGEWDIICATLAYFLPDCSGCVDPNAEPPEGGPGEGEFCNVPQQTIGYPDDPVCEAAVCDLRPECCTGVWDFQCANLAQFLSFSQGEGPGPCLGCVFGEGPPPQPGDSVNMAMFCDISGTGPGFPGNLECETFICAGDPFCCETEWDGLCAGDAAVADECVTCRADYVAPQIPTLSQWGLIILTFLLLQGIWFTAVFKPAAPLKMIPAMWLEGLSYIKNNMVWFLPILVLTALIMSLLYFAGMAQSADIIGAPLTLIILAPSLYWYGEMQSAKTA